MGRATFRVQKDPLFIKSKFEFWPVGGASTKMYKKNGDESPNFADISSEIWH